MRRIPLLEVSVSDDYISGPPPHLGDEGGVGNQDGEVAPCLYDCVLNVWGVFPT